MGLLLLGVLVSVSYGKWSLPADLGQETDHWTLSQEMEEKLENANSSQTIFIPVLDDEQVTLSLPVQWTSLLENLNNSKCT